MLAPFSFMGGSIDAQALAHFNRVIADGGVIPAGLNGVNSFFSTIKSIYGTSNINTAISAAYDPHYLGYKMGAGSGTTLGQAAQTLYSATMGANLITFTDNLAQSYWVKDRATVSVYAGLDPNGTNTAYSVTATAQFGSINPTLTTVANGAYMIEFWARRDSGSNVLSVWANDNNTLIGTYSPTSTWTKYSFQFQRPLADTKIYPIQDRNASGFTPVQIWGINMYPLADVIQGTAASQPLLLTHTGQNYWFGSGVDGNFVSTPNAAANQITGDIDIIYRGSFITNPSTNNIFIGKWDSGLISYYFGTNSSGNLRVGFNIGGSTQFANSSVTYATGVNWYRVTRSASTGVVTFFQSTQNTSDLSSVIWTQLGTTQSTTAGSLTSTTSTVSIFTTGSHTNIGTTYRATIANSIGGVPVVDFNPQQYTPSVSQTSWVSTTGETWTLNVGTATTGYKGAVITKSIIMRDGVDDVMDLSSFVLAQPFTLYNSFNNIGDDANGFCFDSINTSANRILMLRDGSNNFSYESSPVSSGAIGIVKTVRTLELNTAIYNSSSSLVQRNNGTATNGNLGTAGFTSLRLGRATGSGGTNGNYLHSTFLVVRQADNSTQRTAMYNYLRSINNNAF